MKLYVRFFTFFTFFFQNPKNMTFTFFGVVAHVFPNSGTAISAAQILVTFTVYTLDKTGQTWRPRTSNKATIIIMILQISYSYSCCRCISQTYREKNKFPLSAPRCTSITFWILHADDNARKTKPQPPWRMRIKTWPRVRFAGGLGGSTLPMIFWPPESPSIWAPVWGRF